MIELSCDLGEASDESGRAVERELWSLIDAANVACGGHAGDDDSMREAARIAAARGIILGAHPSYPDRENFGRVSMKIDARELRRALIHQLTTLSAIAATTGVALQRVKAHGALYNDAHRDRALAEVLVDAARSVDESLSIVAGDTSEMALAARNAGLHVIREAFADRRYMPDGSLVSRKDPDALLSVEEAVEQAALLATRREVIARGGTPLPLEFDTLCIHADTPNAVERARAILMSSRCSAQVQGEPGVPPYRASLASRAASEGARRHAPAADSVDITDPIIDHDDPPASLWCSSVGRAPDC